MPSLRPLRFPPRFASAIGIISAPFGLLLLALVWLHGLWFAAALIGFVVATCVVATVIHRHLSALDALREQVESLARDQPPKPTPAIELSATAAGLSRAVADLNRGWARRDQELQTLVAANDAILEAIPDPLIFINDAGMVTRANAAARALFVDLRDGLELARVVRHPEVLEAIEEYIAGRTEAQSVAVSWPGPPEQHFTVRLARLPMEDPRAGSILLVLHDVTALTKAEKMRADFVANVSHELRTPLAALLGFTETLRGAARDDAEARERFLGIMLEQVQRMTRLVRDLLSLSRIEEIEHTPPTDRVDLAQVLGSVVDALGFQAKAKNVALVTEASQDLPTVAGDADQLAQVFQNLIDNAIKYGKANGRVRIVVRHSNDAPWRVVAGSGRRAAQSRRGWMTIGIVDDGEGIPPEHLPRLTERFYRVDTARSRQLGGTGLGLAIVKHILNRHRGGLTVDSEPGHGSVFTVWIPVS